MYTNTVSSGVTVRSVDVKSQAKRAPRREAAGTPLTEGIACLGNLALGRG